MCCFLQESCIGSIWLTKFLRSNTGSDKAQINSRSHALGDLQRPCLLSKHHPVPIAKYENKPKSGLQFIYCMMRDLSLLFYTLLTAGCFALLSAAKSMLLILTDPKHSPVGRPKIQPLPLDHTGENR